MKIQVYTQLDYVFVSKPFTISVGILDSDTLRILNTHDIRFQVDICYVDTNSNVLQLSSNSDIISYNISEDAYSKQGITDIQVTVHELSILHESNSFCLQIKAIDNIDIENGYSTSFKCVRYKLIADLQLDGNIWYKDEGGKRNSIKIHMELIDSNHKIVSYDRRQNRVIPLNVDIVYDNHENIVSSSSLLKLLDEKREIDDTGECDIHLRIEDVSKNHQQKKFCLYIFPDYLNYPQNLDIAPVYTSSIIVRSKRNSIAKSLKRTFDSSTTLPDTQRKTFGPTVSMQILAEYIFNSNKLIKDIEWQEVASESYNPNIKIKRCPYCNAYRDGKNMNASHSHNCLIQTLVSSSSAVINALEELTSSSSIMNATSTSLSLTNDNTNISSSLPTTTSDVLHSDIIEPSASTNSTTQINISMNDRQLPTTDSSHTNQTNSNLSNTSPEIQLPQVSISIPGTNTTSTILTSQIQIPSTTSITNGSIQNHQPVDNVIISHPLPQSLTSQSGLISQLTAAPYTSFIQQLPVQHQYAMNPLHAAGPYSYPPHMQPMTHPQSYSLLSVVAACRISKTSTDMKVLSTTITYAYLHDAIAKEYGVPAFSNEDLFIGLYTLNKNDNLIEFDFLNDSYILDNNNDKLQYVNKIVSLCNANKSSIRKLELGNTNYERQRTISIIQSFLQDIRQTQD